MDMPLSERRQIENEMIFRRRNEKVVEGIDKLNKMIIESDDPGLIVDDDLLLHFRCECSDENCDERISIRVSAYEKIHKNRDAFVIRKNHQVRGIEKIICAKEDYDVVEKNKSISEPGNKLNKTDIDNTN